VTDAEPARIVDVGAKDVTEREATASCVLRVAPGTCERLIAGTAKGNPIEAARVAGLMAVKRTPDLLPFCHPVAVTAAEVAVDAEPQRTRVVVTATVRARDRTGVEMEALTSAAVAALSLYDTAKAFDRGAVISDLHLVEKRGGRSGHFRADG
jgi:cyclic pyranopterin phosphate synthase